MLRLFVAVLVPEGLKATLHEVQREIGKLLSRDSTSWTRPEAMHLTLRFLGSVEETRATELRGRLHETLVGFGALDLRCKGLGCFPNARRPRVIWAGVDDAEARLAPLHELVDLAVEDHAEKPAEERFVGHVTLARPKSIGRADAERLAEVVACAADRRFGAWRCEKLALVRSELSPGGNRYTTLEEFAL